MDRSSFRSEAAAPCAVMTTGEGLVHGPGSGCVSELPSGADHDHSQSSRIQEIASEVLRLRLVQSQHRQLEGQLRSASEKLRQMPSEKVLQLLACLELRMRPGGGMGTLGGLNGGADPESLLGLMECLCVVCSAPSSTRRRQEDLLNATRAILQDPKALVERLACLPAASSAQTRRLAPFLLSCDSGWIGPLTEAGQCYEALRAWLQCYYQFSLVGSKIQANTEQLQQQERCLAEFNKDAEGGTGGLVGSTSRSWRGINGVRRSSSVQSNSSTGSRRSQSADRPGMVGLRPSPRSVGSLMSGRESAMKTVPRPSDRPRPVGSTSSSLIAEARGGIRGSTPGRSKSPMQEPMLQASSSRPSLHRQMDKAESSPRVPIALGSARNVTRAGAPPPHMSPRCVDPAKTGGCRRQNVSAMRTRRAPSLDMARGTGPSSKVSGALFTRLTPHTPENRIDEQEGVRESSSSQASPPTGVRMSPRLQSITEPSDGAVSASLQVVTPPLSTREAREVYGGHDCYSLRRKSQVQILTSSSGKLSGQPRSPASARVHRLTTPAEGSGSTSETASRTSSRTPALAASGGTGQNRNSQVRSSMCLGRRLAPSESAKTLRHFDAGSGGTVGGETQAAPTSYMPRAVATPREASRALTGSRSTPSLDMRQVSVRTGSRLTPDATPRPKVSSFVR